MTIDLIITLYTDQDGQDRFKATYPVTEDELVDVTEQFELTTIQKENGEVGFCVFKKQAPLSCLDGPTDL